MSDKKIIIVDENDNIIGSKLINDVESEDIYRVSALWVENSKGDVLLAQRSFAKKHHPGLWGPAVAGTNEEGETYEDNIRKETLEEIGIDDVNFIKNKKERRMGRYNYFAQWFVALIDKELSEFKKQDSEVEKLMWISKKDLLIELERYPEKYLNSIKGCLGLLN